MTEMGMSPADIQAVTGGGNNGGFGGGNIGMLAFFLFFLLAWGNGGFGMGGNAGGALTRAELNDGFNFNNMNRQLMGVSNGIAESTFATSNQLNQMQAAQAACCCDLRVSSLENRYAGERNTCDVIQAIHNDGEATRALINSNTMQELRDRLEQAEREKLAASYQLSQNAQSERIINAIRPCPVPAYPSCSPYTANVCGCGGFGGNF